MINKQKSRYRGICLLLATLLMLFSIAGCNQKTQGNDDDSPQIPTYVLTYAVNADGFGHITGMAQQTLAAGEQSQTVCATPESGYVFTGWSDGVASDLRQGDTVTEDTTITANFKLNMEALEMPMLYINTLNAEKIRSKTEYVNATMTITNADEAYCLENTELKIRGRGNSSWRLAKKPYRIKLDNATNLLGQGKGPAKNWTLIANYSDQSLLRNDIAYYMARKLSGIAYTTSSTMVELFLNGAYQGVYLLCEKIEVSPFRLNIDKNSENADTGFLLEMDNRSTEFDENCFIVHSIPFVVQSSIKYDEQLAFIENFMNEALDAIYEGDETKIRQYVDIDSLLDVFIVQEYFKNIDSGWASFYLYKDAGGKLCFGPVWDFDISAGNDRNLDQGGYKGLYNSVDYVNESGTHPNPLFAQMLTYPWFETLLIERWFGVSDIVSDTIAEVERAAQNNHQALLRNFECWQILGTRVGVYHEPNSVLILNDYDEHVEYLKNWLSDRKSWLDRYFAQRRIILAAEASLHVADDAASATDTTDTATSTTAAQ